MLGSIGSRALGLIPVDVAAVRTAVGQVARLALVVALRVALA